MTNKNIKLKKEDGKLGFVSEYGIFVTDPFESECGRFMMDPIKDYGLTQKQVDEMVSEEKKDIREFVDNRFLARDSRAFREHIAATQPDVNLSYILDNGEEVVVPIGLNFFWPDY